MILSVACRLAPLAPDEPDSELRALLGGLPAAALDATAALAARILPQDAGTTDPREIIVTGLRVLQLVGAHTQAGP
ncbi:hypothetical protein ACIBCM_17745 [Streptomyces sp. NPDC051018]|uniref:hypothetical protein n=1 Tax=Streptomyces sp. NPDC051018 TaxID=3365639 RepID=UPI0037B39457